MTTTLPVSSPPTEPACTRPSSVLPNAGTYPLQVDHVTKHYGDHLVVDDLSFTVPAGRVTGFLGPNGSGKSTTMKIMLDLAAASHGGVTIGGHRYRDLPAGAYSLGMRQRLADDVVVINQGRLVAHGALAELQQSATLVRTADPGRLAIELERAGATTRREGIDGLIVRGMPISEIGERAFTAGIAVHELSPHAGSLEELFLNWTTEPSTTEDVTS